MGEGTKNMRISVVVADRKMGLEIPYNENQEKAELLIRESATRVNDLIKHFENKGVDDKIDCLAMTSLQLSKNNIDWTNFSKKMLEKLASLEKKVDIELAKQFEVN